MGKILFLAAISIVAIGFGIPALTLYFNVYHGFDSLISGIIIFIALLVACALGVVGMALTTEEIGYSDGLSSSEREKLNMMRAHQRATLEEMDEIIELLKEIRDILKTVGE
jgi:hypothetical protein